MDHTPEGAFAGHYGVRHPAALLQDLGRSPFAQLELCAGIADYDASGGGNKTVQVALA
jgi:hypothetical protein